MENLARFIFPGNFFSRLVKFFFTNILKEDKISLVLMESAFHLIKGAFLKITRETDYAIRCMCFLAGKKNEVAMVDVISKECRVSSMFLAKILQKLGKAGLVKSFRGIKGGFTLAKTPGEISLYDVILTIQGPVLFNSCIVDNKRCEFSSACPVHPVWAKLRKTVQNTLQKETLKKLMPK